MTKIVFVLVDILPHLKGIPPSHGQIGMSVEYCQRLGLTWRDLSYCRRTSCWAPRCPLVDWRRWRPSGTRLAHLHVCGGRNTPVMSSFKYHIRASSTYNKSWLVSWKFFHQILGGTIVKTIVLYNQSRILLHLNWIKSLTQYSDQFERWTFIKMAQLFFDLLNRNFFKVSSRFFSIWQIATVSDILNVNRKTPYIRRMLSW